MSTKEFYVYLHRKATNGEVFYVGKGTDFRAGNMASRSDYHKRVVKKYGVIVELYMTSLQEWYAYELERDLIDYYGRKDIGYGTLVNLKDGGDVDSQSIISQETRDKMSKKAKARFEDKEFFEKNAQMLKAARESEKYKKSYRSFINKRSHKIIMDESICFRSSMDAARFLGNESYVSYIIKVCRNEYWTCKGHVFRFADSDPIKHYEDRETKKLSARLAGNKKISEKGSDKTIVNGEVFPSVVSAAKFIGVCDVTLLSALKKGLKTFRGYEISYLNVEVNDAVVST